MLIAPHKTIGMRLLRYVFGCYFIAALVITSTQLLSEYLRTKENMFHELSNIGETVEEYLSHAVWNYDLDQLNSALLGVNKIAIVAGTKVTTVEGQILAGDEPFPDSVSAESRLEEVIHGKGVISQRVYEQDEQENTIFEYKFPITYINKDQNINELLGYCSVYTSHASILNRVRHSFLFIVAASLIKTLALWLIFLFFMERIVAKPLRLLTNATNNMDFDNPQLKDQKDHLKNIVDQSNNDELSVLVQSFLKMRASVIHSTGVIELQNLTLEQRVKERTETIEKINERLKHQSLHDPLTELPNRYLFDDRLKHLLLKAKRESIQFAVVSVDLCKFKDINDNFGHQAGDAVLQELATRMRGVLRDADIIARMGGDEFAVLLTGVDQNTAKTIGEKLLACSRQPVVVENHSILSGLNIGIALYPTDGNNAKTLFKIADMKMYQSKRKEHSRALLKTDIDKVLPRVDLITQAQ